MTMTKENLWRLRKEIVLGSLFVNDYKNSFGFNAYMMANFFDGYMEELGYIMEEDMIDLDDYYEYLDKYDTSDNLWNYYCEFEQEDISEFFKAEE